MAVLAVGLVSCGGGGGDSGSGGSSSGGGTTPPAAVDRVVLTLDAPTAPTPAGGSPIFEVTLTNPTFSDAEDVRLEVTYGAGMSHGSVSCGSTGIAACPSNPDAMNVALLPRTSSLRFRVYPRVLYGASGPVTVSVQVTARNDEVTTNNSAQFTNTVFSTDVSAAIATNAMDVVGGDSIRYSMTVANAGPDAAPDVVIASQLSGRQTLTGVSCVASGGAVCPGSSALNMTIPTLPAGGSLAFAVDTQVGADAIASVSFSARADTAGDLNFGNNVAPVTSAYVRAPAVPISSTFARFYSEAGDNPGMGRDYAYNRVNAVFELVQYQGNGPSTRLNITGTEDWTADLYLPADQTRWQPGTYVDMSGAPSHDPATGGLKVSGPGSGCQQTGWFKVLDVVYSGDEIESFDAIFAQHCNSRAPALRGQIHYVASDATRPPGPVNPPPAGLWSPEPGQMPASGNFVYLQSGGAGEQILQGTTRVFTQANSVLTVTASNGSFAFGIIEDENYGGTFRAMSPLTRMEPGYYEIDPLNPTSNPTFPAMTFSGAGRSCYQSVGGWFVVDNIAFDGDTLSGLDARFEYRCGTQPPVHGLVHWRPDDPTQAPGPEVPPPTGLWAPPSGAVPATGNVVYLHSAATTGVFANGALVYTPLVSMITVGANGMPPGGSRFHIGVDAYEDWQGDFQAMNSVADLSPGYYGNLGSYPNHNPIRGGLRWTGQISCFDARGWFVIDDITYDGAAVSSIEMRFEQYCGTATVPTHGYIRWSAADTRVPLPPQDPPPANLWQPASGSTPVSGNFVYLLSDATSQAPARTYSYTQSNAAIRVMTFNFSSGLGVEVAGDERWNGTFKPMAPLVELVPGYYEMGSSQSNPAKGSVYWGGDRCNGPTGWFVVDEVTYEAGVIRSFDARFRRNCVGDDPGLHGKIHWRFDDSTAAPGPASPPPGLWAPAPGVVPATGNVFYAQGELGEFQITGGETWLYTTANATFQGGTGLGNPNYFVGAQGTNGRHMTVYFRPMNSLPRLQPGYYANTGPVSNGNPTRGGLDFSALLTCGQSSVGWFVIDSVTYDGEQMTSIDARFEYRCGAGVPGLHGKVRWSQ